MNTKLILIALGLIIIGSCKRDNTFNNCESVFDGWDLTSVDFPGDAYQLDICFPNDKVGFSVSNNGSIVKTIDAGKTWKILNSADMTSSITNGRLECVSFVDENNGFIGGQNNFLKNGNLNTDEGGLFLKSTDGGLTWSIKKFEGNFLFKDLKFYDKSNGLGLIDIHNGSGYYDLTLMSTNDGGENWTKVSVPFAKVESIKFIETTNGIGLTGSDKNGQWFFHKSIDNGKSWGTKSIPEHYGDLYFVDDLIGFIKVDKHGSKIYQTKNGGDSWELVSIPFTKNSVIHFKNPNEGFIVNPNYSYEKDGDYSIETINSFRVSQTHDGGITWENTDIDAKCDFTGITYSVNNNLFYSVGERATRWEFK